MSLIILPAALRRLLWQVWLAEVLLWQIWLWQLRPGRLTLRPYVYWREIFRQECYRAAPVRTELRPADAGVPEVWTLEAWTTTTPTTDPHPELIAPCSPDSF